MHTAYNFSFAPILLKIGLRNLLVVRNNFYADHHHMSIISMFYLRYSRFSRVLLRFPLLSVSKGNLSKTLENLEYRRKNIEIMHEI